MAPIQSSEVPIADPKRVDVAVLNGLRWLVRHQNADGSWSPSTLKALQPSDEPIYNPKVAYTKNFDEGLTGLALLCFFNAGFTPDSKQDIVDLPTSSRHKIGDVVKNGLAWLVKRQNKSGSFSTERAFMYNDAIASIALSTAYDLTKDPALKAPAQLAIDFIQGAQRPSPAGEGLWGWRYAPRQDVEKFAKANPNNKDLMRELVDSDTSITGWCAEALAAGARAGLTVAPENLAGALAFTRWATNKDGGVGYIDPKGAGATVTGPNDHYVYHPMAMSALGMCTRLATASEPKDPFLGTAASQIVKDLPQISPDKLSIDYYYWHFATSALNQVDGTKVAGRTGQYWEVWKNAVVDSLLQLQATDTKSTTCGGWMTGDRWAYNGGPLYTTAMNVLTLEVVLEDGRKK